MAAESQEVGSSGRRMPHRIQCADVARPAVAAAAVGGAPPRGTTAVRRAACRAGPHAEATAT